MTCVCVNITTIFETFGIYIEVDQSLGNQDNLLTLLLRSVIASPASPCLFFIWFIITIFFIGAVLFLLTCIILLSILYLICQLLKLFLVSINIALHTIGIILEVFVNRGDFDYFIPWHIS